MALGPSFVFLGRQNPGDCKDGPNFQHNHSSALLRCGAGRGGIFPTPRNCPPFLQNGHNEKWTPSYVAVFLLHTVLQTSPDPNLLPHAPLDMPEYKLKSDHKKVVEVALNLKTVYSVDDKEHNFHAQVVLHLRYDSTPLSQGGPEWEPLVSILNARDLDEVKAPLSGQTVSAGKEHHAKMRAVTKHYDATFVKSLNLRSYPFDSQILTVVLVGDEFSLLTHMVDRDEKTGNPLLTENGNTHPHRYIKSIMDDDALTEWEVLVAPEHKERSNEFGTLVPVISRYQFQEHEHDFGGGDMNHGRMDFDIFVHRRWQVRLAGVLLLGTAPEPKRAELTTPACSRSSTRPFCPW
jgi:hypothetical protein